MVACPRNQNLIPISVRWPASASFFVCAKAFPMRSRKTALLPPPKQESPFVRLLKPFFDSIGQLRPGRADSRSGHVRYAAHYAAAPSSLSVPPRHYHQLGIRQRSLQNRLFPISKHDVEESSEPHISLLKLLLHDGFVRSKIPR